MDALIICLRKNLSSMFGIGTVVLRRLRSIDLPKCPRL